jgi:hypothetical protein
MSDSKICSTCNIKKEVSEFNKNKNSNDGFQTKCKLCTKKYNKERYLKNTDILKIKAKKWSKDNSEKRKEIANKWANKKYYDNIYETRAINRFNKKNMWKNKTYEEKVLIYKKNNDNRRKRCENNQLDRLKHAIRTSIGMSIIRKGYKKKSKSFEILNCSYEDFKIYLESQFKDWMNWDNYGKYNGELNYGWDIDHIIPLSSAKSEEDIIRLNHYTNFQPLCSKINRDIKRG